MFCVSGVCFALQEYPKEKIVFVVCVQLNNYRQSFLFLERVAFALQGAHMALARERIYPTCVRLKERWWKKLLQG
ncbi:hypothetical protein ANTPLA_LOCUS6016 [Anthophora plagiata]